VTSYSTFGVGRIAFVDGDLSPWEETRDEQTQQVVGCLASGAVRALLDQVRDLNDLDDDGIDATQWHSPAEGWELGAVVDDDRAGLVAVVEEFVRDCLPDILCLARRIAWGDRWRSAIWHGDTGMGVYRVGYLLGMQMSGNGIGFADYTDHRYLPNDSTSRMTAWLESSGHAHAWEDAFIDSAEEPCLLHVPARRKSGATS
jgi:hypothetical protein